MMKWERRGRTVESDELEVVALRAGDTYHIATKEVKKPKEIVFILLKIKGHAVSAQIDHRYISGPETVQGKIVEEKIVLHEIPPVVGRKIVIDLKDFHKKAQDVDEENAQNTIQRLKEEWSFRRANLFTRLLRNLVEIVRLSRGFQVIAEEIRRLEQ